MPILAPHDLDKTNAETRAISGTTSSRAKEQKKIFAQDSHADKCV